MAVSLNQTAYIWRNDDGSESGATSAASVDSPFSGNLDTNYRLRIGSSISGTGSVTWTPKLQYNKNGAGWNDVNGASSVARSSLSPNVTDNAATTNQISGGGAFAAGQFDEADGTVSSSVTLSDAGNVDTEHEFCLQMRSADLAAGDTVQFRLIKNTGATYDNYGILGTFVVAGGSAAKSNFLFFFPGF